RQVLVVRDKPPALHLEAFRDPDAMAGHNQRSGPNGISSISGGICLPPNLTGSGLDSRWRCSSGFAGSERYRFPFLSVLVHPESLHFTPSMVMSPRMSGQRSFFFSPSGTRKSAPRLSLLSLMGKGLSAFSGSSPIGLLRLNARWY